MIRRFVGFVAITLSLCPAAAQQLSRADAKYVAHAEPVIAITNVTVIDGTGAEPKRGETVLLQSGRIVSIAKADRVKLPAGTATIDGTGKTLVPGFVMMHEHLFYPNSTGGYGIYPDAFSRLYLAGGETTIRTAGSIDPYADLATARAIAKGVQVGPDIDVSGPYLDGQPRAVPRMPTVTNPQDAARIVDYWASEGATSFKVYEHITLAELKAVIAAAHARHFKVTGHICSVTYAEAVLAGIDNLEHSFAEASDFAAGKKPDQCVPWPARLAAINKLDPNGPEIGALIKLLVDHKVALTSTLPIMEMLAAGSPLPSTETMAVLSPALKASFSAAVTPVRSSPLGASAAVMLQRLPGMELRFIRAGGLLMAGSDPTGFGGVVPGPSAARQYTLMVAGGFSAPEAIQVMSLNGATYLGRATSIGSIEAGKRADVVLLDGDLAQDPTAINRMEIVFKAGIGYSPRAIKDNYAGRIGID